MLKQVCILHVFSCSGCAACSIGNGSDRKRCKEDEDEIQNLKIASLASENTEDTSHSYVLRLSRKVVANPESPPNPSVPWHQILKAEFFSFARRIDLRE